LYGHAAGQGWLRYATQVLNVRYLLCQFCRDCLAWPEREHVLDLALAAGAVLLGQTLEQPVGMGHARHRVGNALKGGRDRDDLLDAAVEPLDVVLPVEEVAELKVIG